MRATPVEERLRLLHAHYTERINVAIEAGRMDLAQDLADACEDEALELMLTDEAQVVTGRPVEIMDVVPAWPWWPPGRRGLRRGFRRPRRGS